MREVYTNNSKLISYPVTLAGRTAPRVLLDNKRFQSSGSSLSQKSRVNKKLKDKKKVHALLKIDPKTQIRLGQYYDFKSHYNHSKVAINHPWAPPPLINFIPIGYPVLSPLKKPQNWGWKILVIV